MGLALFTLTLDDLASLGLDGLSTLPLVADDPITGATDSTGTDETITYDLVEIRNISQQLVPILIQADESSPFFRASGNIYLQPGIVISVEPDRTDITQLKAIQKKGLITVRDYRITLAVT
jgi:hypothetical protein